MKNVRIGVRLSLGFGALIALLVITAVIGIVRVDAGSKEIGVLINDTFSKLMLITDTRADSDLAARNLRNAMLANNAEDMEAKLARMAETSAASQANFKKLKAVATRPDEQEVVNKIADGLAGYLETRIQLVKILKTGDKVAATDYLFNKVIPVYGEYTKAMNQMVELEKRSMNEDATITLNDAAAAKNAMVGMAVVAAILGVTLGILITRSITRPLQQAVTVAEAVAAGDLTTCIDVTSKDETGQLLHALKRMNENLIKIVGEVRTGSDNIASATTQIASGNLDLSSRTEQQAGALEETASSMEEMTSTVKQNADNARQANQLAASAAQVADKGGIVVAQVVDTMGAINASAKKVTDIIEVIDGIAFQTNILALNAAVEAARAGEQGRGFAVVATEVRNLAQRSAAAAKEIKALIDDSANKVETGAQLVTQAGATMTDIVASIKRVTDIVSEIADASQEQTSGIDQINQAIMQMDQVTQQNAALVEEAAAASGALQEQAGQLAQAVSVFKLNEAQVRAPAPAPVAQRLTAPVPKKRQAQPAIDDGAWEQF